MQKTIQCDGPGGVVYPLKVAPFPVKVFIHGSGTVANHNYPCMVCREEKAMLDLDSGLFQPCHQCASDGFKLVKSRRVKAKLWVRIIVVFNNLMGRK
jgi:hypothetical protein